MTKVARIETPERRAILVRLTEINRLIADQGAYLERLEDRRAELERELVTVWGGR